MGRIALAAVAAGLLFVGSTNAEEFKSGLQAGTKVPTFHPLHVNGESAGTKACLV
jgi:hypothetical protein